MRVTEKDIEKKIKFLNSVLEKQGVQVELHKRYGYKAIDLYRTPLYGHGCLDTLRTGMTSGQAYDYINAMIQGIALFSKGWT